MKNLNHSHLPSKQTENLDGFFEICSLDDLRESVGKRFIIDDVDIALFKIKGEVFALSNTCPHQHTTLIYDGFIEDNCIVCPVHGWKFNLRTGRTPAGNKGLDNYQVNIINDKVFVKVVKKSFNW